MTASDPRWYMVQVVTADTGADTATWRYPLFASTVGTNTPGSSDFATIHNPFLVGILIQENGSGTGVLTIDQHGAGAAAVSAADAVVINIVATVHTDNTYIPLGWNQPAWTGIRARFPSGTGQKVFLIFEV